MNDKIKIDFAACRFAPRAIPRAALSSPANQPLRALQNAGHDLVERGAIFRFQGIENIGLAGGDQGREFLVERHSRRRQAQDFRAPVVRILFPPYASGLFEAHDRAAHLHFVERRIGPDILGRHPPVGAERRQHPPFRARQVEAIRVDLRDGERHALRQNGQTIGKEPRQFEGRFSQVALACDGQVIISIVTNRREQNRRIGSAARRREPNAVRKNGFNLYTDG